VARDYILKLSESEWSSAPWQGIYDDVKRAADEYGAWMDFTRIGFMRALYPPGDESLGRERLASRGGGLTAVEVHRALEVRDGHNEALLNNLALVFWTSSACSSARAAASYCGRISVKPLTASDVRA
jgi:hypothetical protein